MIGTIQYPVITSLTRQVNHWLQAASRLSVLDHLASGNAWQGIDHNLGVLLRNTLQESIGDVVAFGKSLKRQLEVASDEQSLHAVKNGIIRLRESYLKAEETVNFYTVAINSRTTANVAALLRACDILCMKSMLELLQPLGKQAPPVLTYIDKGIGASILKAGLRLWDGKISPVAAIKITQHNLFRPTAIIHETGHQVAHITNWNDELGDAFLKKLSAHSKEVREAFADWASEIAADAFAFVHTGYAAVVALHDVLSGSTASVFSYHRNDPHPIAYIRVLMNIEMCRLFFGKGPWDELEVTFKNDYDITRQHHPSIELTAQCVNALPDAVRLILKTSYPAFNNQPLTQIIRPENVSPQALQRLEYISGPALYTSHAWLWKECIRLLAINGYKIGIGEGDVSALYKQQEEWMIKLGFAIELN